MTYKKILLFAGVAAAAAVLIYLNLQVFNIRPGDIEQAIDAYGWMAPVIYIVLYTLRSLVFFPASVFSLAGGLAFGPAEGVLYIMIGAMGGAVLSFYIARLLGGKVIGSKWKGKAAVFQTQLNENGFLYALIMRLIPVLNFDLVSYICGLSTIRFRAYAAATLIGIFPGALGYSLLGSGLVSGDFTQIIIAASVFLAIAAFVYLLKRVRVGRDIINKASADEDDN
ncbi:TVP38/TMEM64 family protein [Sinobaca sp. H24]|uniref:TVP38/TMEM64 family protein n=1 Tax=Sinobaca sp. H24 TaxID=2923376 RepID=UPI0020792A21|nr:TVP38/TMEM64 family protein [Sinobaca sp. H24]